MAYVDLNPVRACIAFDLESSEHASIKRRLLDTDALSPAERLRPVAGAGITAKLGVGAVEYLQLVDWTGQLVRTDNTGVIDASIPIPAIVLRRGLHERPWQAQVLGIESRYWRAVGTADALVEKARALGQR